MWPFRPPQTPVDASQRHQTTLDLIEQVAALRGQVRAIETEWDDAKGQIKKAYQRMERANQRAEEREGYEPPLDQPSDNHLRDEDVASGFAGKVQTLQRMRGVR